MLTNSMYFQSQENLRAAQDAFGSHPDLTILLRDFRSLDRAQAAFPSNEIIYCPDIALGCPINLPVTSSKVDVLVLRRNDRGGDHWVLPTGVTAVVQDWELTHGQDRIKRAYWFSDRVGRKVQSLAGPMARLRPLTYAGVSKLCVNQALRILSQGRVLVTDRMHAAVMGAMLGMPTVAVDLAYDRVSKGQTFGALHEQKISAAYECWMGDFPNVVLACNTAEVEDLATGLLRQLTST